MSDNNPVDTSNLIAAVKITFLAPVFSEAFKIPIEVVNFVFRNMPKDLADGLLAYSDVNGLFAELAIQNPELAAIMRKYEQ